MKRKNRPLNRQIMLLKQLVLEGCCCYFSAYEVPKEFEQGYLLALQKNRFIGIGKRNSPFKEQTSS